MDVMGVHYPILGYITLLKEHYCYEQQSNIVSPSILSLITLKLQCNTFKCTMKANHVCSTMELPILVNPFTLLWITLSTFKVLQSTLSEYFKLAKIVTVQVLRSMEDEWTFSTSYFMKSKLRNKLNEHFHVVVRMYSQTFFTFKNFMYNVAFEEWQKLKNRRTKD